MKVKQNFLQVNISQYTCFFVCLCLMIIIPIVNYHKIIGLDILKQEDDEKVETVTVNSDGETVINTTEIGKEIVGYGGPTPLEIYIKDGKITKIVPLTNRETPEFFGAIRNSDILESFNGLTPEEAAKKGVDGVSGATYSSNAVIANMKRGVEFACNPDNMTSASSAPKADFNLFKFIITIIIIGMGAVIPLFLRNKNYRTAQLILNILILGFWGGTFISYSMMVSLLTNGITTVMLIPVMLMLVTAFIYPMFGKANHYCNWICPYGSLQELLGKCIKKKIAISGKVTRLLSIVRNILWFSLMWLLWTGIWTEWMGYEPFAAFFFTDASAVVLGIAGAFLLLSIVVQRPYCRFVCPTGSLFKLSEGRK